MHSEPSVASPVSGMIEEYGSAVVEVSSELLGLLKRGHESSPGQGRASKSAR